MCTDFLLLLFAAYVRLCSFLSRLLLQCNIAPRTHARHIIIIILGTFIIAGTQASKKKTPTWRREKMEFMRTNYNKRKEREAAKAAAHKSQSEQQRKKNSRA